MDTKIFALIIFVGVLGTFMEAQATHFGYPYPYGNGQLRGPTSVNFDGISRSKREIGDSNGETTTSQATTTTPSTTNPTTTPSSTTSSSSTTPSSTTQSSTTPSTSPTTTPSTSPTTTPTDTTTEATSPTTSASTSVTTPTTTSATTPSTSPTTPSTTTPESTKSSSKPKKSTDNDVQSRSNFDESEASTKKPGSPSKGDKTPTPGPFGPGIPGPGFGPGFDPYFGGYPGFNSIPGAGPNYAWTGTNNGPGYSSAGASAGSFAGGYPGFSGARYPTMGYPNALYPGAGYPRAEPPMTTESPSFDNRGGFQDNSPNYGIDPLYNAGPGFFFPGQFPSFNDPTFDMIRQIQAQIEAQHQANMEAHNRLANEAASYGGGSYGGGVPQISSASIGLGPGGGFQTGLISPGVPGLESRFAEELPAPSGNSFGVFASSSSSSRTGPDGKQINHKSSITGVNDNGKVSFRTVHD
ncbi:hypothetical protein EAG_14393 [Camponotus floridanus]|uniref:Uncharacterized protein n=1 Tax=Camponotus floridanus TaxID=104421 RepID=E2ABN3_CAMFO|nr:nuclear pore complex protein DDB_G0274915 [Camponotus floridanus]EFN69135.1 hypothetical protein EAG_14393 [Camponotus floridanus]